VLGHELAGEVVEVVGGAGGWAVGDRVQGSGAHPQFERPFKGSEPAPERSLGEKSDISDIGSGPRSDQGQGRSAAREVRKGYVQIEKNNRIQERS
jgi:hypothetical protein